MEAWQSPVYCSSLENCRSERVREFESHCFHQFRVYDSGSRRGLEPCSASSILATLTTKILENGQDGNAADC